MIVPSFRVNGVNWYEFLACLLVFVCVNRDEALLFSPKRKLQKLVPIWVWESRSGDQILCWATGSLA